MNHTKPKHTEPSIAKPIVKPNAERIWKQLEDDLAPRLGLRLVDRVVYSHLLRHSRLEGKAQLRFSVYGLARRVGLSCSPVREAIQRLERHGILRLVQCSNAGHVAEIRAPEEVHAQIAPGAAGVASKRPTQRLGSWRHGLGGHIDHFDDMKLEQTDFLKSRKLRRAIHARERGFCFYCLRRLKSAGKCLDHVVPRCRSGRNSYRNLVSCCSECNSQKGRRGATGFLRWLYREQRLTGSELTARLRALEALTAGKLLPPL
jgi:predicted DNA-binding transcriptional regulator